MKSTQVRVSTPEKFRAVQRLYLLSKCAACPPETDCKTCWIKKLLDE